MVELLPLANIRSSRVRRLNDYWLEKRGRRDFPAKRDIEPLEIVPLLPFLSIAELHNNPFRVRYRLVGTAIVRLHGGEFTGRWLDELPWPPDAIRRLVADFRRLLEGRAPLFGTDALRWEDGRLWNYEWAFYPLADDGHAIKHCLIIEDMGRRPI